MRLLEVRNLVKAYLKRSRFAENALGAIVLTVLVLPVLVLGTYI